MLSSRIRHIWLPRRIKARQKDVALTSKGDEILAQRLRELRTTRELTQREMADLADMPYETYCGYERAESRAPFSRIRDLAVALDVSLDYLAGLKDPAPTHPTPHLAPPHAPDSKQHDQT